MPLGRWTLYFAYLTAFWSGATMLSLEITGSRLLAPYYGAGLYVWSSLLVATMTGLGLGYHIGGRLADYNHGQNLIKVLFIVGISLLLVVMLQESIIVLSARLGLRWGSLAAATAILGPPLTFLGVLTPCILAFVHNDPKRVGKDAGRLYSIGTFGSLAGGLATGFVFLEYLSTNMLLAICGGLAILLGIFWIVPFRRQSWPSALLILGLLGVTVPLLHWHSFGKPGFPNRRPQKSLWTSNSVIGEVQVAEVGLHDQKGGLHTTRILMIDGRDQTIMEVRKEGDSPIALPRTGGSWNSFAYDFQMVRRFRPEAKNVLVIGLGGGLLPLSLAQDGMNVDVVEIHPDVIKAACSYFLDFPPVRRASCRTRNGWTEVEITQDGVKARLQVTQADARSFIRSSERRYDIVICNAIRGDVPPAHLYSVESLSEMRDLLNPKGILALNLLAGSRGDEGLATSSVEKTLGSILPFVRTFSRFVEPKDPERSFGDVYLFASGADLVPEPWPGSKPEEAGLSLEQRYADEILTHEFVLSIKDAVLLSDSFNPLDIWLAHNSLRWFEAIEKNWK